MIRGEASLRPPPASNSRVNPVVKVTILSNSTYDLIGGRRSVRDRYDLDRHVHVMGKYRVSGDPFFSRDNVMFMNE